MTRKIHLLLIEDSEDDERLLLRRLRSAGFEVSHLRVEDATQLSAALAGKPWDIVISDSRLPGFDGLSALRMAKAAYRDLPFLLISGELSDNETHAAMAAGAHDCIEKSHLARIGQAVESALLG